MKRQRCRFLVVQLTVAAATTSSPAVVAFAPIFQNHKHHALRKNNLESHYHRFCPKPWLLQSLIPSSTTLRSDQTNNDRRDEASVAPDVLCVGETLWDSLPNGMYLGGAPSNVAVHLASLFRANNNENNNDANGSEKPNKLPTVALAVCLGNDQLGNEAVRRLCLKNVRTDYIQRRDDWDTGMSIALLDPITKDASYEFNTPAAWDGLVMNDDLWSLLNSTETSVASSNNYSGATKVFVIGTIASRLQDQYGATSASTITTIRNHAPKGGNSNVVLDINLRHPWYSPERVLELCRGDNSDKANKLALLKLNEEELVLLEQWTGLSKIISETDESPGTPSSCFLEAKGLTGEILEDRMKALANSLNAQRLCVTRGKYGAALWCECVDESDGGTFCESLGYSLQETNANSDTVGAGDSFLASLITSLFFQQWSTESVTISGTT